MPSNAIYVPIEDVRKEEGARIYERQGEGFRQIGVGVRGGGFREYKKETSTEEQEAKKRAEELSKLGEDVIKQRQDIIKEFQEKLAQRDMTRQERVELQRDVQQKLAGTREYEQKSQDLIRQGKTYEDVTKKEDESIKLPQARVVQINDPRLNRETVMVQNPQTMGRRTIDVNQPAYVKGEKVYAWEILPDLSRAYFKGLEIAGEGAKKQTTKAFETFAPSYKGINVEINEKTYQTIKQGSIAPDESPYLKTTIPARNVTILSPERVSEGVGMGTSLGLLLATPPAVVNTALIIGGTERALTADSVKERLIGAGEAGLGVFGATIQATSKVRSAWANRAKPEIVDIKTTVASPNTREKFINKFLELNDARGAVSQRELSSATVFNVEAIMSKGKSRGYQFIDFGKSKEMPNTLFKGKSRLYGVGYDQKGNIIRQIGAGSVDVSGKKGGRAIFDIVSVDVERKYLGGRYSPIRSLQPYEEVKNIQGTRLASESKIVKSIARGDTSISIMKGGASEVPASFDIKRFLLGRGSVPSRGKVETVSYRVARPTSAEISFQKIGEGNARGMSLRVDKRGYSFGRASTQKSVKQIQDEAIEYTKKYTGKVKGFKPSEQSQVAVQKTVKQELVMPKSSEEVISAIVMKVESQPIKQSSIYEGLGLYEQTTPMMKIKAPQRGISSRGISSIETFRSDMVRPSEVQVDLRKSSQAGDIIKQNSDIGTILDTKSDSKVKLSVKTRVGQADIQGQGNTQGFTEAVKPKQDSFSKVKLDTRQINLQATKSLQSQILKQKQENIKPSWKPLPIKSESKIKKAMDFVKEGGDVFKVFGKRFGKDTEILKTESKEKAEKALKGFLKGTLGRSGFITKDNVKIKPSSFNTMEFTPSVKDPLRVVQKTKYSLGTGQEVREIQYFKKKSKKKRGKL